MHWFDTLTQLHASNTPYVMVTIASVRGHAPRQAGSKMIITPARTYGSVGGGNLEETAIYTARQTLQAPSHHPATQLLTLTLNPNEGTYGTQCCGGEVTLLMEHITPQKPTIMIFGAGHVGQALMFTLSQLPVNLQLIDSRDLIHTLTPPENSSARIWLRHMPVPEAALEGFVAGSHVLIMTHDHAEDIAILDRVLTLGTAGFIGLIGSSVKWAHFKEALRKQGHTQAALETVTTPIGLPEVPGKSPPAIAIATAAQLLTYLNLRDANF